MPDIYEYKQYISGADLDELDKILAEVEPYKEFQGKRGYRIQMKDIADRHSNKIIGLNSGAQREIGAYLRTKGWFLRNSQGIRWWVCYR